MSCLQIKELVTAGESLTKKTGSEHDTLLHMLLLS